MKDIKKEDIENLSYKDITYLILENEKCGINTLDLFTKIVNLLELPKNTIDASIADYYTSLTTDKRFLMIDGMWDLRNRHTSDKVLTLPDEEDEEEELAEQEEVEDEEPNFDEEVVDDENTYDDEDDGLSDLVVLDEDDMDIENN